jgi:antitoxin component YwqK of YwqJK toxin-antitoxin module
MSDPNDAKIKYKTLETWHPNGQLQSRVCIQNGLRHGLETIFNQDGICIIIRHWNRGKKQGREEEYNPNGTGLISSCNYADDQLHGISRSQFVGGIPQYTCQYINGKKVVK